MLTLDDLKARLRNVKPMGADGFVSCCPAHKDDKPSLKVSVGRDGRILLHCHAGCSTEDVVSSLNLKMSDLMPERKGFDPIAYALKQAKTELPKPPKNAREVAHYDYEDEDGTPRYRVIRLEPKSFRQAKINADGSLTHKMDGVTRYPYHLTEVIKQAKAGGDIIVAEGEKDVDRIRAFGFTATCNAGGAGKFDTSWVKYFKGAGCVRIIADNDSVEKKHPGQRHAWTIFKAMQAEGINADILTMPEGKDTSEYLDMGHNDIYGLQSAIYEHQPWPDEWKFDDPADGLADEFVFKTLEDFPKYSPEETNKDILIKGRWLERGGSAWWVSTAGTGKSIASLQAALCWTAGKPFAGLTPNLVNGKRGLKVLIIQSEDSPSRVAIDREDITAELVDQYPDVDWIEVRRQVQFFDVKGLVGADFIKVFDRALQHLKEIGKLPDIVIINPFLAYVGGQVTDGAFVTPFFRGGEIQHKETVGLQYVLEKYNIGILIFHHTPKPPNDKELDAWMKSAFPEYQGAGSSDITNWGRSFVTMMRVKGEQGMVCITAGKNGQEIGWDVIDGAPRRYLAYSGKKGVTGGPRHAWRELMDEELARVTKDANDHAQEDIDSIVNALKETPMTANQVSDALSKQIPMRRYRIAWKKVSSEFTTFGLTCKEAKSGRSKCWFFGLPDAVKMAVWDYETGSEND